MKFTGVVTKNMTIRIPAIVAQRMNLEAGDAVELSIEHALVSAIANSDKFTEYCKKLGSLEIMNLHCEYKDTGGLQTNGSFKTWLVKKLKLADLGLSYWGGEGSVLELFPDGKVPKIDPVGPGNDIK